MDFKQEITNHLEWMEMIASLISNEALDAEDLEDISRHDHCALGHWIDSPDANEFRDTAEFVALVESHNAFHNLAGDFIAAIQQGNEQVLLDAEDDFIHKSQQVIAHLQALQEISEKG